MNPERPKENVCTCEHHMLYHTSWGNCLVEGCGCKGYVDGPAAYELGEHPTRRKSVLKDNGGSL